MEVIDGDSVKAGGVFVEEVVFGLEEKEEEAPPKEEEDASGSDKPRFGE